MNPNALAAGQSFAGQSFAGQSFSDLPFADLPFAGQPFAGQSFAGQCFAGQSFAVVQSAFAAYQSPAPSAASSTSDQEIKYTCRQVFLLPREVLPLRPGGNLFPVYPDPVVSPKPSSSAVDWPCPPNNQAEFCSTSDEYDEMLLPDDMLLAGFGRSPDEAPVMREQQQPRMPDRWDLPCQQLLPARRRRTKAQPSPSGGSGKVGRKTSGSRRQSVASSECCGGGKRPRTVFSDFQSSHLKAEFRRSPRISRQRSLELAEMLGITETMLSVWFKNQRTNLKKRFPPVQLITRNQRKEEESGSGLLRSEQSC